MEDSGAILCQISSLKFMLDQVNEEIEANIQTTREIESEIFKCSEIENGLALRESELMRMKCGSKFEINGWFHVAAVARSSLELLEKELSLLRMEHDKVLKRIANKRESFLMLCKDFQRDISKGENEEMHKLLAEKEVLESENYNLNTKFAALRNSVSAFVEEILEDLCNSNSALQVEIQRGNLENKKLLQDIEGLKSSLIAISSFRNLPMDP